MYAMYEFVNVRVAQLREKLDGAAISRRPKTTVVCSIILAGIFVILSKMAIKVFLPEPMPRDDPHVPLLEQPLPEVGFYVLLSGLAVVCIVLPGRKSSLPYMCVVLLSVLTCIFESAMWEPLYQDWPFSRIFYSPYWTFTHWDMYHFGSNMGELALLSLCACVLRIPWTYSTMAMYLMVVITAAILLVFDNGRKTGGASVYTSGCLFFVLAIATRDAFQNLNTSKPVCTLTFLVPLMVSALCLFLFASAYDTYYPNSTTKSEQISWLAHLIAAAVGLLIPVVCYLVSYIQGMFTSRTDGP